MARQQNNKWTVEQRYRRIEDISDSQKSEMIRNRGLDAGYPNYHIAPAFGLLNDPNGLCYFNGEHHVFYQWTPVGPVHGMKYWYHLSTPDFIHFTDHGIAIHPDQYFDSHGAYSGGAIVEDDKALLFYTGNQRDENWNRIPTQCYATLDKSGVLEKKGIIVENSAYTEHFRDPKVWKQGDDYFMVVGAQTQNLKGAMVLYHSQNLTDWVHKGPIHTSYNDFGYMWECPDFFELDGQAVMLFSPQGVSTSTSYDLKNIFSVTYLIGDRLNLDSMELEGEQSIQQPDYGFDFYAPQTYVDEQGRRIMYAWVGLPDIDTPSVKHEWAGMLTLPRELHVQDGFLVQKVVEEITALRNEGIALEGDFELPSKSFCLTIDANVKDFSIELSNRLGEKITFTGSDTEFTLDRSKMSELYAEEYGLVRKAPRLLASTQQIEMYIDQSVIEIFINDGKHTMTSRFFVHELSSIKVSSTTEAGSFKPTYYSMKSITGLGQP